MEQNQLDRETFTCLICLDLLNNPVTTSCGHSYCKNCIETHWDGENWKRIYSCPQCRERFIPRPVLKKNTMLAALLEQLKKAELQAEDVACDSCTGRKLKAIQSCLDCLASFCEKHLQPHYDSAAFKKHKLVEPSKNLQENICSKNDEVTKMFCRTDQKCVCLICLMDEYKGHNTVSAATEGTERQRELEERRENIQQRIQEEDVKPLQQEVEAINRSADKTVEDSEKIFTQLIRLLQKISSDVKQQIRSQQETEVSRVKDLQEKLEQLSHTEDHIQFLFNYPSLPALSKSTYSSSNNNIRPLRHFEDVTAAVSELRDKLHDVLRGSWTNILHRLNDVDVLLPGPEPKSRAGFLKYSFEITLDPDTAHTRLLLSEGNRKVTGISQDQSYSRVRDRFTNWWQVLSRESLTGRCYWEVERCGTVDIAVAYKNISRAGSKNECGFGNNEKSWALECSPYSFHFGHNDIWTPILAPVPSRVGVYLDHRAGILSFYSVSETMTLLCRVKTTFTEPLLAGVWVGSTKDSAEFCNL
ncbi:tripartite motif-containing protein 16-like [Poeciliopsis prolifica]|uniref:tripartite motif-containing protein 16-like n=1 Tax=Poeciliopsis prolifica TaxID=188132 RepID=UPI0024136615|nr:tripartite motif-containing protein 16-like [Poeciliopsis prolifica]